jgi:MscS family membrane protein
MEQLLTYLQTTYFGNTILQYILTLITIFITLILRYILHTHIYKYLDHSLRESKQKLDFIQSFKKPITHITFLIGFMIASHILTWPSENIQKFLTVFFQTMLTLAVGVLLLRSVNLLNFYFKKHPAKTKHKEQLIPLISKSLKIFIAIIVFAAILQNLGYSISGLLAGLGIGGIAIALAAKDSLSNLFGSVTIFLDNPFQIGDRIKINEYEGFVESIGFRSTQLRTFQKSEVSIPNSILSNAILNNFSRMEIRRVNLTLRLTYDTPPEKIEATIQAVEDIFNKTEGVDKNTYFIYFEDFNTSSLDIAVTYYTNTTEWNSYIKIRQEVNLKIMKALKNLDVRFAYQTMTLLVQKNVDGTDIKI